MDLFRYISLPSIQLIFYSIVKENLLEMIIFALRKISDR